MMCHSNIYYIKKGFVWVAIKKRHMCASLWDELISVGNVSSKAGNVLPSSVLPVKPAAATGPVQTRDLDVIVPDL